MTVKELKDNLAFYDDDAEVIFEIDCEIEPQRRNTDGIRCILTAN